MYVAVDDSLLVESRNENVKGKRNGEQSKKATLTYSMELKYTAVKKKT